MNLRDAIDKDVFNIDEDNYTDADFLAMSIDELETLKMRIDKIISELSIAIKEKQIEYQNGGKGFTKGWYSGHKGYLTINQRVLSYVNYLIKKRRREGRTISDHFMEQAKTFLPRNDFDNILNKALQEMGGGGIMRGITGRQKEMLDFIEKFISENVYSPTIREIGDNFQMSPKSAQDIVVALKRKGYLKSQNGKPRTLAIIKREKTREENNG